MKLVIATPIVYNASSPFNHLFKDIIGKFLEDGINVIRLAAVQDVNDKEFKYGYTGKTIEYKIYKRKNSDRENIMSRYIRDMLTNIREAVGILGLKNVDVLFEDVSYSSFWAVKAAKIKGIKVVAMLQDVWPDNAVQSQLIVQDSLLYKYFEMLQRYVYRKADRIICISEDMKAFITSKGINPDKIEVIYNWGYSDELINIAWENNEFVKKFGLDKEKFYVIYAGNIGKMQNVEIVVKAAKVLEYREDIQFLIIGDGVRKQNIEEMATDCKNIQILPMQPSKLAPHIYSAAGVNIISLIEGGIKTALPSKTGVILSCGRPVIFTYGKESKFSKLVAEYGAGISVDANDEIRLAEKIIEIAGNSNINPDAVYRVFKDYFTKSSNVQKYSDTIRMVR